MLLHEAHQTIHAFGFKYTQKNAIERMQISSGLYQMQHVLCDLILFQYKEKKFVYLEEVPFKDRHDILRAYESVQYCAFLFAYHLDGKHTVFDFERAMAGRGYTKFFFSVENHNVPRLHGFDIASSV